jgi:general L-amino acid transport system permease protein
VIEEARRRRHAPVPLWRDVRVLSAAGQAATLLAVVLVLAYLLGNLLTAMSERNLFPRYGFLGTDAGFEIGQKIIPYQPTDSYAQAFLVGLVNTVAISLAGIVFATLLGLGLGIARLSPNWLLNRIAYGYVEVFRNTPLLLQLFVIYFAVLLELPPVRDSIGLGDGLFVNQRGVYLARPVATETFGPWLAALGAGVLAWLAAWRAAERSDGSAGRARALRWLGVAALVGLPIAAWLALARPPIDLELPVPGRFNLTGGIALSPELTALLVGLSLYTAAFIAEIVRAGIQAVGKGQLEAGRALGLREGQLQRLVVLPQALRVIVPPLTSQYLNLVKNSSLGIALGYADLFNVSATISSQTGQPIAVIVLVMAFYLSISLATALLMNLYNRRIQLKVR